MRKDYVNVFSFVSYNEALAIFGISTLKIERSWTNTNESLVITLHVATKALAMWELLNEII